MIDNNLRWIVASVSNNYRESKNNTFVNPYSYLLLRKEKNKMADNVMIDGLLFVFLFNFFLNRTQKRISFDMTSLAPVVFCEALKTKKSIFFIGSCDDEVKVSVKNFSDKFEGLIVAGFREGYFSDNIEKMKVINNVRQLNPDIVIAGMGTPLQEQFLLDLRMAGWSGTGFTCGGFFHQTAKSKGIDYYPKWIDRFNLRWLYRMYDEPKLIKRYTIDYTKFLFVFSYDVIVYRLWIIRKRRV